LPDLPVDAFVLDNRGGGSGKAFNWEFLSPLSTEERQRCLLAGGIGPDSIESAIELGFAGVDINSQAEWKPGVKNSSKIAQTFTKIRHYGRFSSNKISEKHTQQEAV